MRYIIIGDVHADLNQFIYPLFDYFEDPLNTTLIYLGDYFDRGDSDVFIFEIINTILKFKANKHPAFKNIILLRGNHECYDIGTVDLLGSCNKNLPGFIVSFLSEYVINNFKLPLFYYNEEMNILFSHSPHSQNSLNELLQYNNLSINGDMQNLNISTIISNLACSVDKPNSNCTYRNVHGHDHKCSKDDDIISMFSDNSCNMISLDNDSSYGFRAIDNVINPNNKNVKRHNKFISRLALPQSNRPYTQLMYVIVNPDKKVEIVRKNIYLLSLSYKYDNSVINSKRIDFNSVPFVIIRTILMNKYVEFVNRYGGSINVNSNNTNNTNNIILKILTAYNPWETMDLTLSNELFKAGYQKMCVNLIKHNLKRNNLIDNLKNTYNYLYKNRTFTKDQRRLYLHNVPSELHWINGARQESSYIPCWRKFFTIVDPFMNNQYHKSCEGYV